MCVLHFGICRIHGMDLFRIVSQPPKLVELKPQRRRALKSLQFSKLPPKNWCVEGGLCCSTPALSHDVFINSQNRIVNEIMNIVSQSVFAALRLISDIQKWLSCDCYRIEQYVHGMIFDETATISTGDSWPNIHWQRWHSTRLPQAPRQHQCQ